MAGVELIDLSEHLPPVPEASSIRVLYDTSTKEVISFMEERSDGQCADLAREGCTVVLIRKTEDALKYADTVYAKNYYDEKAQMVIAKPVIVLTPSKTSAIGNGEDIVTITVNVYDYTCKPYPWEELKFKCLTGKDADGNDIPGIAQVSTEVLTYDPEKTEHTIRVRSFSRGKTRIKGKYNWKEGSPVLSSGAPSFPISYGEVELSFTNPGF